MGDSTGLGLRARLTLSLALLLSAAVVALSLSGWWYGQRLVRAGLEEQAATTVRWLARSLEFPLAMRDREALARQVEQAAADPDVLHVAVSDEGGRVIASAGRRLDAEARSLLAELPPRGAGIAWLLSSEGEPFYGCVHPLSTLERTGPEPTSAVLRVALSSRQAQRTLLELRATLFWTAVALLALGMFVAYRLGGRLAAPIEALAQAARGVAQGRLDVAPPRNAPGEIGQLAAIFGEMTSALRRQGEQLREMAERDLLRERTRWDVTVNALGDPIAICDAAGGVIETNEAFRKRAAEDGIVGAWFRQAEHGGLAVPDDGRGAVRSSWEMTVGDTHFLASRFPLEDDAGPQGCVVVLRDVTERDRARDQLAQAEKMSALGLLVSGVAHEINNPLAGIIGFAQLAVRQPHPPATQRSFERIEGLAERCVRIVRNLLSFARPHPPERRAVDLNALVRETLELRTHDHAMGRIRVDLDLEDGLPSFSADPHQLQQVLLNLVINAEQAFRPKGGGTIRVSTRAPAGERVVLAVEDDGPGIPAENLARIFDPFFTTKPPGVGTGLGLSLSLAIVREHQGTLRGESRPEGGARFVVELPLAEAPAEADASADPAHPPKVGRRILVVDDEQAVREVVQEALEASGYSVQVAGTVSEALESLGAASFDLVLTDLRMPGQDGRDLVGQVAKSGSGPRVAFLTGDSVSEESRRFLEESGRPVLHKPFRLEELVAFVARAAADPVGAATS